MTALIVIFITLSLMGSALWIMPPKKERQRMALRMHARKLGLTVQLTSIDLPDKWDKSMNRQKTIAYSFYRLKPVTSLPDCIWLLPYEVWKYNALLSGWWSSELFALTADAQKALEKYGALLVGVKITPECVSLYWDEAGDESVLDELATLVFSLAEVKSVPN
ncbi:MAG: hypothetical protein KJ609_15920 [Gammaproteobacteria bacterium]|nr:hypothetical protein [Gammaproteobacteria bacterium]MBU1467707.1 hypothetical protein [Gammaproteobacteria bacterium]MBU2023156.1 hypothetical protein [Gammaproteobacteria bacterium]MBU2320039.1 hypothetical protein [Gammaproteobacteria bacterium]MBU2411849.1 hypothetical protein [Gammaproteobacteria bacterium]|tara:strand:+ start:1930 stop:2418 length:489 start_codon:yes stop_codon:yes gene_type:complete